MGYEICDMSTAAGRAKVAAYEAEKAEKVKNGQQLYAKIKRTSKYYGQGERGALFPVYVEAGRKVTSFKAAPAVNIGSSM